MEPALARFQRSWAMTRKLTFDLVHQVPPARLTFSPHPDSGTLGREIRNLAAIQTVYVDGLESGTVDFENKPELKGSTEDKKVLEAALHEQDKRLERFLAQYRGNPFEPTVTVGQEKLSVLEVLYQMAHREALRQGQWSIYALLAGFDVPDAWFAILDA